MRHQNKNDMVINPFILYGYESEKYFCDRKAETEELKRLIVNGNNVALIAPRRIGKTGLIEHLFHQKDITHKYYTFLIDIYATNSLRDFVYEFGKAIMDDLKPKGRKVDFGFEFIDAGLPATIREEGHAELCQFHHLLENWSYL